MYIRRKVFSLLNVEGEEKYFSTNEITLEDLEEKIFSINEEEEKEFSEKKRKSLKDVDSNKGLKRAILTAPLTGGGSLVGGYLSKEEANKADEEGESDEEIVRRAKSKGLKAGAITAGGMNLLAALAAPKSEKMKVVSGLPIAVGFGALGGRNAAGVNTKARLKKRKENKD